MHFRFKFNELICKLHHNICTSLMQIIWFDLFWSDLIWFDMIWYDMIWFDLIRSDLIWFDRIWSDLIWFDLIWSDLIGFDGILTDLIRFDLIWCDLIYLCLLRFYPSMTCCKVVCNFFQLCPFCYFYWGFYIGFFRRCFSQIIQVVGFLALIWSDLMQLGLT